MERRGLKVLAFKKTAQLIINHFDNKLWTLIQKLVWIIMKTIRKPNELKRIRKWVFVVDLGWIKVSTLRHSLPLFSLTCFN